MQEIAKALNEFQKNLPEVKLDATVKVQTRSGSSYNFKYATLLNIIKTVTPDLTANGLSFTQTFINNEGKAGLITTLLHTSGEQIVGEMPIDLQSGTMQEIGSRISYLKRYALTAILGIVGEEDDDANIADGNAYQKTDKPKTEKQTDKEISSKQWNYMKKIAGDRELTETELIDMVKWFAEKEKIQPRHWKIAKLMLPEDNFEKVFTEYCEWQSASNSEPDDIPY